METYIDPKLPCPGPESIRPDAVIVEGRTHTGRACRIVDNTCSVPKEELIEVLNGLITERRFGIAALSPMAAMRSPSGGRALPTSSSAMRSIVCSCFRTKRESNDSNRRSGPSLVQDLSHECARQEAFQHL